VTSRRAALSAATAGLTAALAIAVASAVSVADGADGIEAFESALGAIVLVGVVILAIVVRPSVSLSAGLALAVFNSHWNELGIGLPLDRVLLATGATVALVREWRTNKDRLRTRPIHWLIALAAAWAIGSALVAGTIDERDARFLLLDRFSIVAFILFFVAPFAFREERDRRILLGTLVGLGGYLGVTAVIEETGPRDLLFPSYIDDPTVGIHFDRSRGPFVEAAGNGLALYACAVAAAIATITWTGRRARGTAAIVGALCLVGTLLTMTRAVWIAAIAGTIVALLSTGVTRRYAAPVIALAAVLVVAVFAVSPTLLDRAEERQNAEKPLWDRYNSNSAALRMIEERPAIGFGWGRYPDESAEYYRQGPDYPLSGVRDVHNVYLANAAELGLIGVALWIAALLAGVGSGALTRGPPSLKPWKIGLLAVATSYAVAAMTTPLAFTFPTLLLWLWAGVATIREREPATPSARA
jgi:putative inorganic carbon (hco3(-)) transporter